MSVKIEERTPFPAVVPDHLCTGIWMDDSRNMGVVNRRFAMVAGWAPCEQPRGHVTRCGPRAIFDVSVEKLGTRACHVVGNQPQLFLDA